MITMTIILIIFFVIYDILVDSGSYFVSLEG